MGEFRYYVNRLPSIAKDRSELAAYYRNLRKSKPALARLLFVRMRAAVKASARAVASNLYG